MTQDELQLIKSLVEKVNRLEKRLILQEAIEQAAGGGGGGSYTNEQAQDAVGSILVDSATVDFTYDDAANTISAIVPDNAITNAKLATMAQATVKGRAAGAGTGAPVDLTAAQVATILGGSMTGGGALATGGFTLTVPATGTAALLGTAQTFTAAQSLTQIKAASASGLTIEDDGGNVGLSIADGGVTTIAGAMSVSPVVSGIRSRAMHPLYDYSIAPGAITTAQTWTMDITLVNVGPNFGAIVDVDIVCMSNSNAPTVVRALYRASIAFYRATSGATGVITTTTPHISSNVAMTITTTGIADGIRITVTNTVALQRTAASLTIVSAAIAPTVTSTVA